MFIAAISLTRGFTGHEHLDQVGLIHMGGRVYDPEIGRFLSPDPFVQFPASTQGFNRYAYVGNNPLSYTDPSGYFLKKLMKVAGIGMNFIPGWTLMNNAFIHGFVSGFLASEGDVKAGMMGMMSAGIAGEIGKINDLNDFSRSALHGITQGAVSAAGGGRFGDGALGAFAGSYLSFIPEAVAGPYGSGGEWAKIGRMTAAAVVGGTASALGGGKFANGAWSAAFVSRFNHDAASQDPVLDANVCSDAGFECRAEPIRESLELVASSTVTLGVSQSDSLSAAESVLQGACTLIPGCVGVRVQMTVIESAVDLFRVREVGTMIVTTRGRPFGSFRYHNNLTDRYIEIARGPTYGRVAGPQESMMSSFRRYPVRVDWSSQVGYQVPESSIQRRW